MKAETYKNLKKRLKKLDKLKEKRVNRIVKKVEDAFLNKHDGSVNFSTQLFVPGLLHDDKYFGYAKVELFNKGIIATDMSLVLTDKTEKEYPLNYFEVCDRKDPFLSSYKLWYTIKLEACLSGKARNKIYSKNNKK